MAWEGRSGGHYYYRKVWRKGTCYTEYVGSGWLADMAANVDARERQQRRMTRLELERVIHAQRSIDQAVDDYHNAVRDIVAYALQRFGFHLHKGQWRKARKMTDETAIQASTEMFREYNRLLGLANAKKPKPADLELFRQYGLDHPEIFDGFTLLAKNTVESVIDSTDANEATKIHVAGEVRALRRNLGYSTSSYAEKLLIEDVAVCWLRLQLFEQTYTHNYGKSDGLSFAKAEYMEKRLSATRRRYLQAVESLARVRALLSRVRVQINVAQQQVVIGG